VDSAIFHRFECKTGDKTTPEIEFDYRCILSLIITCSTSSEGMWNVSHTGAEGASIHSNVRLFQRVATGFPPITQRCRLCERQCLCLCLSPVSVSVSVCESVSVSVSVLVSVFVAHKV